MGTTVVVTHGRPIRVVPSHLLGLAPDGSVPVVAATPTVVDRSWLADLAVGHEVDPVA
ncbi:MULTISPECIES: hypothetical protein [unclassified Pseudonocardia]|uniref:hypothetical protein n=1 Tax=unclassified Pseudonocardia TaxID=2619320 RepID=UPI001439331E|nr:MULTISPECIES: hypothetical protein [unclassified Pseudonocardia]